MENDALIAKQLQQDEDRESARRLSAVNRSFSEGNLPLRYDVSASGTTPGHTTRNAQNLGETREYPAAVDICYAGGLAMINAAGFAQPATAEAGNAGCVGVFLKTVDNSGGSAGDLDVEVEEGDFLFDAASIVQGNLGEVMYASDDQTFDETQGANEPQVGQLVEFVSTTSGYVRVSLATSK